MSSFQNLHSFTDDELAEFVDDNNLDVPGTSVEITRAYVGVCLAERDLDRAKTELLDMESIRDYPRADLVSLAMSLGIDSDQPRPDLLTAISAISEERAQQQRACAKTLTRARQAATRITTSMRKEKERPQRPALGSVGSSSQDDSSSRRVRRRPDNSSSEGPSSHSTGTRRILRPDPGAGGSAGSDTCVTLLNSVDDLLADTSSIADLLGEEEAAERTAANFTPPADGEPNDLSLTVDKPVKDHLVVVAPRPEEKHTEASLKKSGFHIYHVETIDGESMNVQRVASVGVECLSEVKQVWTHVQQVLVLGGRGAARVRACNGLSLPVQSSGSTGSASTSSPSGHRYLDPITGTFVHTVDKSSVVSRIESSRVYRRLACADTRKKLCSEDLHFDPNAIWQVIQRLGRLNKTHQGLQVGLSLPGVEYWGTVSDLDVASKGASVISKLGSGSWGEEVGLSIHDFRSSTPHHGSESMKAALAAAVENFNYFLVLIAGPDYQSCLYGLRDRVRIGDLAVGEWMPGYLEFEVNHILESFFFSLKNTSKDEFASAFPGFSLESAAQVARWLRNLCDTFKPTYPRQALFERDSQLKRTRTLPDLSTSSSSGQTRSQHPAIQRGNIAVCKFHVMSELGVKNKDGHPFTACDKGSQCLYKHPAIKKLPREEASIIVRSLFSKPFERKVLAQALKALGSA